MVALFELVTAGSHYFRRELHRSVLQNRTNCADRFVLTRLSQKGWIHSLDMRTGKENTVVANNTWNVKANWATAHFLNHFDSTECSNRMATAHGLLSFPSMSPANRSRNILNSNHEEMEHPLCSSSLYILSFHAVTLSVDVASSASREERKTRHGMLGVRSPKINTMSRDRTTELKVLKQWARRRWIWFYSTAPMQFCP